MVPRGATVLDNPNGSAPGLLIQVGDRVVLLLPGPPREMKPMFEGVAAGLLAERVGRERFYRATIFIAGRSESHVEEAIQPIYGPLATAFPPIETTILAAPGQIEVHLTALSDDAAAAETAARAPRGIESWQPSAPTPSASTVDPSRRWSESCCARRRARSRLRSRAVADCSSRV